jgi:hypothetical protein
MTGREEQAPTSTPVRDADAHKPERGFAHTRSGGTWLHDVKYDEAGLPIRRRPSPALAERVRRLLYG